MLARGLLAGFVFCAMAGQFGAGEPRIVRLKPEVFRELPDPVLRELNKRGCTIPQHTVDPRPHNVIRGEFARPGQQDWAVVCSRGGASSILVFWNGETKEVASIGAAQDEASVQRVTPDEWGYSRGIGVADRESIVWYQKKYGDPHGRMPRTLDHQGIEDAFLGKASVIRYFTGGKWLVLQGAD